MPCQPRRKEKTHTPCAGQWAFEYILYYSASHCLTLINPGTLCTLLVLSASAISAFSKICYLSNLNMSAHAPTTPHKSRVEQTLHDYLNDYNLEVPNLADSVKPGPNTRNPEAYSLEDIATTVSKGEASTTRPCGNATRKLWTAWWWQNQHPLALKRVSSLPEHSIFLRFAFCNVL
jgi:hypothetical protein